MPADINTPTSDEIRPSFDYRSSSLTGQAFLRFLREEILDCMDRLNADPFSDAHDKYFVSRLEILREVRDKYVEIEKKKDSEDPSNPDIPDGQYIEGTQPRIGDL